MEQNPAPLPKVLLLEDEPLFVLGWETMLAGDAEVLPFSHPEAFLAAYAKDPQMMVGIKFAIIDHFYGPLSRTTGLDFAPRLRTLLAPGVPIYLASTGIFPNPKEVVMVDKVIDKVPVDYIGLLAYG